MDVKLFGNIGKTWNDTANWGKTHGVGVSSTTIAPDPWHTNTKTPDAKHTRMSPTDPDAERPALKNDKVPPAPRHQGNNAPPPMTAVQWNLNAQIKNTNFVSRLGAESQDDPTKNYQALVDNPAYFDFGGTASPEIDASSLQMALDKGKLVDRLDEVKAKLNAKAGQGPALPPEMKGAEMTVVTQAAALACKGGDPRLAAAALQCLSQLDMHASIADPQAQPSGNFEEHEVACAWRIAQALEQTPLGFAALKKLTQSPHGGQNVHASVAGHDDTMLHAYFKASREKTRQNPDLGASPKAMFESIPEHPVELLDKSLGAIRNHLTQSSEHAQNTPGAEFKANSDVNEWAIAAVNNGFYTDKLKDEHGNPTPFAKAENRLKKMSKWVSRANGTNNQDPDGSHTGVIGAEAPDARKATRFLRNTLLPGMKKSPFNALNRQASPNLPYVGATAGGVFRNAEGGGGVGQSRAIKTMTDNLETALKAGGASLEPGSQAANPSEGALTGVVRLAVMAQAKKDALIMPNYVNLGLDDDGRTQVKAAVYAALEGGFAAQNQETKDKINALVDNQHTNLTPETLVAWAHEAGCPRAIPHQAPVAAGQPDWHAFKMANKQASEPLQPTPTPNLKTINKAATAQMVADHTKTQELGSRVVLYSGGAAGFGTGKVTGLVSNLISKKILKVKADVRGEGARCATLEIGTAVQGNELFLGTQRIGKAHIGGGAAVGTKISNVASATFGGNAGVGFEGQDRNGVMIRFDRLKGGVPGDKANNAKLARLAGKLMAPGAEPEGSPYINANGEDGASMLKNLLQEWPEVSVSLVETKDKAGTAEGSVSAGLGAKFGKFSLGLPHAGVQVDGKFKGRDKWTETGGRLHVDKQSKYWTAKAGLSAGLASLNDVTGNAAKDHVDFDAGLDLGDFANGKVNIWKNGYSSTDTLIEFEGQLDRSSVRVKNYHTAQTFVNNVAPQLDRYAEMTTKRFNPGEYGATAPENETPEQEQARIQKRNTAIEAQHKRFSQYLQRSKDMAEPTQDFWEFKQLNPDACAAANALKSVAMMAQACGDNQAAQDCTKYRDKLLKSEEAWDPTFLVDYDTTSQQRTMAPVNFLIKPAEQVDGIVTGNIRTFS